MINDEKPVSSSYGSEANAGSVAVFFLFGGPSDFAAAWCAMSLKQTRIVVAGFIAIFASACFIMFLVDSLWARFFRVFTFRLFFFSWLLE